MFNKFDHYFREELSFLKEQGHHYSEFKPHLSRFLYGSHSDPDVERLLEGFAFLTSRLRAKVDDDFPELTHSIINMMWPNFMKPFPSVSIIQFSPIEAVIKSKKVINRGVVLASKPIRDGIKCYFTTCRDISIYPIERKNVQIKHTKERSSLHLEFQTQENIPASKLGMDTLTFFIGESGYESNILYLWLHHFLESIEVHFSDTAVFTLSGDALASVGWTSDEGLLPYPKNVYEGYRLLHEYLAYPDGFLFIRLQQLEEIFKQSEEEQFNLVFKFTRALPADLRVTTQHMQIHAIPAINLFKHDANPIDLDGRKTEYKIFSSTRNPSYYEIFNIESVVGWDKRNLGRMRGDGRKYTPFESFQHEIERVNDRNVLYYRIRTRDSHSIDGFDSFISFVRGDEVAQVGENETISIELTCTNRYLPLELGKGDINSYASTTNSVDYALVANITEPSEPLHPVLDGSLLWTLISNLSLNYLSLLSKEALRTIIRAYDFKALIDRQAEKISKQRVDEGIIGITTKSIDRIYKGMPIRGLISEMVLDQEAYADEGDLFLFSKVLSHFFRLYATVNSFHDLTVVNQTTNEHYIFANQQGNQPLI